MSHEKLGHRYHGEVSQQNDSGPKARASRTPETGQSAEVAQDVPTVRVAEMPAGEATPETLRAYLDHLAESSRRFDSIDSLPCLIARTG